GVNVSSGFVSRRASSIGTRGSTVTRARFRIPARVLSSIARGLATARRAMTQQAADEERTARRVQPSRRIGRHPRDQNDELTVYGLGDWIAAIADCNWLIRQHVNSKMFSSQQRQEEWLLERLGDPAEEPGAVGAVDDAVVVGQRER